MDKNELKHVGVLGMKWGHRRAQKDSGGGRSGGAFSKNRSERIKVANELAKVRSQRSKKAKIADWLLSGPQSGKQMSEAHGKSAVAKKGSQLSNKLQDLRKNRTRGEKVIDALMTPGTGTKTFTERPARERRRIVALTAIVTAGAIGLMKLSDMTG